MNHPSRRAILAGAGLALPLVLLPGCATTLGGDPIVDGLRRLLTLSSQRALTRLVADNGYFNDPDARITLPGMQEGRSGAMLGALLRSAPVQRQLMLTINRAAGDAADRAAPLILDSIRSLTFTDALGLVRGGPTAATTYLERAIGDRIIDAMFPEIGGALRQFDGNSILGPVLGAATGIDVPGIQRVVTRQAARGLWRAIGREEAAIRAAPSTAGDPLIASILSGSGLLR
ncbi:DUF4197 domain-containing protein [Sphingomonas sp. NBWT7]|uniref:DUF4197 domain-containing protein n=1 Tax=Sphingomonas sp. NBWT7 TaxID=2596913 RepID=UPI001623FF04|nr:DUF4197 domain-containing protein [Sphingomonas sp. NBWT7]QNE32383.1 DUF4197 domain-containing protein [Sphingomonas sp. NBWT7]